MPAVREWTMSIMPAAARLLAAVWWGGLTLYAGVVVPIGTELLGATAQGFVTQRVTHWLNGLGAATLVLTAAEVWCRCPPRGSRVAWGTVAATLVILVVLHPELDALLDSAAQTVSDTGQFYAWHRAYLWVTAVQWLAGGRLLISLTRHGTAADTNRSGLDRLSNASGRE